MKPSERKCLDYYLSSISDVQTHLTKGFLPYGSAFYHPDRKCCVQPLIKYVEIPYLKEKERKCLCLLLEGLSRKKIAQKISSAPDTVKDLIRNLKRKWEVNNTKELIKKVKSTSWHLR